MLEYQLNLDIEQIEQLVQMAPICQNNIFLCLYASSPSLLDEDNIEYIDIESSAILLSVDLSNVGGGNACQSTDLLHGTKSMCWE